MRRTAGIAGWLVAVLAVGLAAGVFLGRSTPTGTPVAVPTPTAVAPATAALTETATIARVIDGDSLELNNGAQVRLLGIDAPEASQPGGDIARDFLRGLVEGEEVRLEGDQTNRDKYSRLLRYVYLGPLFVNGEMVSRGYAIARFYPPDERHRDLLESLQLEAEQGERGLWPLGVFQASALKEVSVAATPVEEPGAEATTSTERGVISWRDAAKYYGKVKTLEGTIVATHNSGKACFLNFHEDWRTHFTAVIFASDFGKFPRNPEDHYLHKKVRVRGLVKEYRGKPEIVLQSPQQIDVVQE